MNRSLARRRALHPGEPWLWPAAWENGCVHSRREGGPAVSLLVFGLAIVAVVGGAGILAHRAYPWNEISSVNVVLLLFAVIGLALAVLAVYRILAVLRFAPTVFRMTTLPGVLGGPLRGQIEVPANVPMNVEATLELRCVEYLEMPGKYASQMATDLWREERRVVTSSPLTVAFTVPHDLPPATTPGDPVDPTIRWLLAVTVALPGVDWRAEFAVPVFATPDSDPTIRAAVRSQGASK